MITSVHNPRIQWVKKLQSQPTQRRDSRAFVVEGVRLAEEALSTGWGAQLVLYSEGLSERGIKAVEGFQAQGAAVEQVTPEVLRSASDTPSPQGLLAVLDARQLPVPQPERFILIADNVRDPGNLGTILRTAAAAGVDALYLPPGGVDPWAPKVVRSAMGAHFRLPALSLTWEEIGQRLVQAGARSFLADATTGTVYSRADLLPPLAIIVGGEAEGASPAALQLADERVHIPMPGGSESLNTAIAAAILLFEAVRQRDKARTTGRGGGERK